MATTIPFPFRDYAQSVVDSELLEEFIQEYEEALADWDQAAVPEDRSYYEGSRDAFTRVLVALLPVPVKDLEEYFGT